MDLPPFLEGIVTPQVYARWLKYRAIAHCKRDCKRGNTTATARAYREAIHTAVLSGGGVCFYTGEDLDWHLISTFNDEDAKKGGRDYLSGFASLPTVDHVDNGLGPPNFVICSFAVNSAKSNLSLEAFLVLCKKVVKYQSRPAFTWRGNIGGRRVSQVHYCPSELP